MKKEEQQLSFLLTYIPKNNDVFIRANAVLWFQREFFQYWKNYDEANKTNFSRIIHSLYISDSEKSLGEIALSFGIHVRTLNRYREKFLAKMKEIIFRYIY